MEEPEHDAVVTGGGRTDSITGQVCQRRSKSAKESRLCSLHSWFSVKVLHSVPWYVGSVSVSSRGEPGVRVIRTDRESEISADGPVLRDFHKELPVVTPVSDVVLLVGEHWYGFGNEGPDVCLSGTTPEAFSIASAVKC